MADPDAFSHFVRAALAIILTVALPVILYTHTSRNSEVLQVYLDALAAVVAFYFGASSQPGGNDRR